MSVTLKDIADKVNVSVTTVSRVVNYQDTSICSEETQKQIWKLVHELGYKPKGKNKADGSVASELRIGYVLGDSMDRLYDPHFSQLLKGIEAEALASNVHIAFGCFTPELYKPEVFSNILESSNVGAVIFMSHEFSPLLQELRKQDNIHVIVAGVEIGKGLEEFDYVGVDFYNDTIYWLQNKMLERFESIGYVGFQHTLRYRAFVDAHKLMRRSIGTEIIIEEQSWTTDSAKLALNDYLESGRTLPEALFVSSDALAIGTMIALKQHGLRVPEDVKIMGFDNIEMSNYVTPSLTTIDIPKLNIGRAAVRAAIERIKGERDYLVKMILPTEFIQRESL